MPNKSLWGYLHHLYDNQDAGNIAGARLDNSWFVDPVNGNNARDGRSYGTSKLTLASVLALAVSGDFIFIYPGQLDEGGLNIARAQSKLTLIGVGGRGSVFIEPSTEDLDGLAIHADDVTLINIGIAAEDETAGNLALDVTGSRLRAYGCKIEGGEDQLSIGPGTVAQEAAGTRGRGGDCAFYDCEFCWGTNGVDLVCTDFGAVTQVKFYNCLFHNITGSHVKETVGSGGSAAVGYRDIWFTDCFFSDLEDGTAPTKYFDLNDNNANTGVVTRCSLPTAINSGLNLVSTAMHWVSNFHTGGISTAQPS